MRRALTVVGVLAVALGLAFALAPELAAAVGTDEAFVTLIGVLAALQGLRAVQSRRRGELRQAEFPTPETPLSSPVPGDEFDESLITLGATRRGTVSRRRSVRERLAEAAVAVVERRENCSRDRAIEIVERGEWTDDPLAAAFLGGENVPSPPLRTWLRGALSGQSRFRRRAVHTVDAIAALAEVAS